MHFNMARCDHPVVMAAFCINQTLFSHQSSLERSTPYINNRSRVIIINRVSDFIRTTYFSIFIIKIFPMPESVHFIYNTSLAVLWSGNLFFEGDSANESRLLASINFWLEIERVTYDATSLRLS